MKDARRSVVTRERIVKAALALFCARGYSAVGTQDICTAAGVLKGSLYHFFPTKLEVALAALKDYGEQVRLQFDKVVQGEGTATERLRRLFESACRQGHSDRAGAGVMYGCLHGNLAMELSTTSPEVREALEAVTASWARALHPLMQELTLLPPDEAARVVLAYLHGIVLMAKSANDPDLITSMGQRVFALLSA